MAPMTAQRCLWSSLVELLNRVRIEAQRSPEPSSAAAVVWCG